MLDPTLTRCKDHEVKGKTASHPEKKQGLRRVTSGRVDGHDGAPSAHQHPRREPVAEPPAGPASSVLSQNRAPGL